MNQETKICQNCKNSFVIEPDDFDFYAKIQVPPPTFCWRCRLQRRMNFRNERTLYKRKCNAPGHNEEIFSVYSPEKPLIVYDDRFWWSDAWDPLVFGRPYDFNKPFFEQYGEFLHRVPLISLSVTNMANCNYCNVSEGDKDSYLLSASFRNERVFYANRVTFTKDSADLYISDKNELCYDCVTCKQSYRLFFSFNCVACLNSAFLSDCINCQNCFGCSNLRNKQYYFFNKPYSKEEYFKKIKDFDLGSFSNIQVAQKNLREILLKSIHRYANIVKCVATTGDNVLNAKNCKICFDVLGDPAVENSKYINWGGFGVKDSYDAGPGAGEKGEQLYEVFDSGIQSTKLFFTGVVYTSYNVRYSINCHGSHDLFGCYGLRNKEYCVLNKQYTKEEYKKIIPQIINHMDAQPYKDKGERVYKYGEFFPAEIAPFAYNESIACDYFPLTKVESMKKGFAWRDSNDRNYQITKSSQELPDHIKDVSDEITDDVIGCAHNGACSRQCATAFRILPQELRFYRNLGIALPRLCFNCRHHERLAKRNPLKLWHRQCQCAGQKSENSVYQNTITHQHGNTPCPNEFETSYAPERSEIVYCEQCYQVEVV